MTFQKMLRAQLIVAGFGAALMLATAAKAQEITNTEFNDGPYVAAFAQPVVTQSTAASSPVMTEPQAMQAIAAITAPVFADEETLVAASSVERWIVAGMLLVAFFVIGFCCLAELNALTELKRANRSLRARTSTRMSPRTV
jgi:uncharacterized membrane protein affecting hemolysin expression